MRTVTGIGHVAMNGHCQVKSGRVVRWCAKAW